MKYKINTLTPAHIGTGINLEPFEYVVEDRVFYRLDQNKAFSLAISENDKFPELFDSWLNRNLQELQRNKNDNRKQSEIRKNFNFNFFCSSVLKNKNLADRIVKECHLYKAEIPFGMSGKKVVAESIKDSNKLNYIPGSSIKGFIRTALLFNTLSKTDKTKILKTLGEIIQHEEFVNAKKKNDLDQYFFANNVFNSGYFNKKNNSVQFEDIKFDMMKFILISDAYSTEKTENSAIYPVNLFLTNKDPQPSTPALEMIKINSSFEFSIDIKVKELLAVYKQSLYKDTKIWIDFPTKFSNLFGFRINDCPEEELEEKILQSIKDSIKHFTNTILLKETEWMNFLAKGIENKRLPFQRLSKNLVGLSGKFPKDKPLMRIGWGSGFISTTIFLYFLMHDDMKSFVEQLFFKFKIGIPRGNRAGNDQKGNASELTAPNIKKFPKSRRLINDMSNNPVLPLGWMVLLDENESCTMPEISMIDIAGENPENPLVSKPTVPEPALTVEQIIEKNKNRKPKQGDIIEAKFLKATGSKVYVKILHPLFVNNEYSFTYNNYSVLEEKGVFNIKITNINKSGQILAINFLGFLKT